MFEKHHVFTRHSNIINDKVSDFFASVCPRQICWELNTIQSLWAERQWKLIMKKGKKITILGAGNVGASIAYTFTMHGLASEIVLIDINFDKAKGEAMDIIQGTAFCPPVNIYAGDYPQMEGSDIVVITLGQARKPGQTRIDLAQSNVDIIKSIAPNLVKYAHDSVFVIVSNPVDIITYALLKFTGLPANHIIGTGTMLDSARLRTALAEHVDMSPQSVHAYVFGEHGDSSMIPWSLTSIGGMSMTQYCEHVCEQHNQCGKVDLAKITEDVKTSGAKVIALKGATYYAIALSALRICDIILRDSDAVVSVSSIMTGEYGIEDVCFSLPTVVGINGIKRVLAPPLLPDELEKLNASAELLKSTISELNI